jgi:hypothetical protein
MKININKNEEGLLLEFENGPTYLVRYENIPDEWIEDEIALAIEVRNDEIEEGNEIEPLTRDEARKEAIEEIEKMPLRDLTSGDLFTGLGWEDFKKELFIDKPFSLSDIWNEADLY